MAGVPLGSDVRIRKDGLRGWRLVLTVSSRILFLVFLYWFFINDVFDRLEVFVFTLLYAIVFVFTLRLFIRRLRSAEVIVTDLWIEHWVGGEKRQTLVLDSDLRIYVDLMVVDRNPVRRRLVAIKVHKRGLGSIDVRRVDGWTEDAIKELWWGLYARNIRYRFRYETEVELVKQAGAERPPSGAGPA